MALDVHIKRVYETAGAADGLRVLVDRVWPRGLTKEQVAADRWVKEAAPSTALRRWFGHDPSRWAEFRQRYFAELKENPVIEELLTAAERGRLTLLYSARDEEHNQAAALQEFLLAATGNRKTG